MPRLDEEVVKYVSLKDKLTADEFDAVYLLDTLEGATDLHECLEEIAESALEDEKYAEAIASRMTELQERKSRFEVRAEKKRRVICAAMNRVDLKKVERPNVTISVRNGSRELIIMDESKIPEMFFKPQPPKLDGKSLRTSLEDGPVEGAVLGNGGQSVSLRVR